MTISPVPTTRVSDSLVRERLIAQVQSDQQELFRIQAQISTGRRISLPSEDAPAAGRAIELQRLIERKDQVKTNLATNNSYLTATDGSLANVGNLLSQIRATALGSIGATATDSQRDAAKLEVQRALDELVDIGNQKFRGRYLFAGTNIDQPPFTVDGKYVTYNGNEGSLSSYADLDLLFESNVNGQDVFGALSQEVQGRADLDPIITDQTRLADLHGGRGVRPGSIAITDGTNTSIVDLSGARTVGDVIAAIEAKPPGYDAVPPAGREIRVSITDDGFQLTLDAAGGGDLRVNEVGSGATARDLGILHKEGVGPGPFDGEDLDPQLKLTTSLANLLGVRATASLDSAGGNNDILFEVNQRGAAGNDLAIQIVDDDAIRAGAGIAAGNEYVVHSSAATAARASVEFNSTANNDILFTATNAGTAANGITIAVATRAPDAGGVQVAFNAITKTYTISAEQGVSTASDIVNAVNTSAGSGGVFSAALDTSVDATNDGSYVVQVGDANAQAGNTSQSGGAANTLFVYVQAGATNANQVVDAINSDATASDLLTARLNDKDTTAEIFTGRGIVSTTSNAVTAGGSGVEFDKESGLQITNGGEVHTIDLSSAETVEDLLNLLNSSDAGVIAQINPEGTGINVRSRVSGGDFSIGENGGTTATELGIRTFDATTRLSDLNYGKGVNRDAPTFVGADIRIRRTDGVLVDVDLSAAKTVSDVLDAINNNAANTGAGKVTAQLAETGNGIELVEAAPSSTATLEVSRLNQSKIGWDLGLIPEGSETSEAAATPAAASASFAIAGTAADVRLTANAAGTPWDGVAVNFTPGASNTATFDATNKRLDVTYVPGVTVSTILGVITSEGTFNASLAPGATTLPTDPVSATGTVATTAGGSPAKVASGDRNPLEVDGAYNALVRLADALANNDDVEIGRAVTLLDSAAERITFSRATVGARQQGLDVLAQRLDGEVIDLKGALSQEIDVDLPEAISNLTAKQAAFQASLQMSAQTINLTLLDYL
jgi:flagellin-like hook-associated protein FlgL